MAVQAQLPGSPNKISKQFDIIINNISRKVELFKDYIFFQLGKYESGESFLEILKIKQENQKDNEQPLYSIVDNVVVIRVVQSDGYNLKTVGDVAGYLASINIPVKGYKNEKPF